MTRSASSDQTHKVRLWASYDLATFIGKFNFSALQRYDSGTPFSAAAAIDVRKSASLPSGVVNPGYATPPTAVTYFFSKRGEFRWQAIKSTDLAATYSLPIRKVDAYIEGYAFNVFNHQAQIGGITTIRTARTSGSGLLRFNPFTDTPKECPQGTAAAECNAMGANWQKATTFGNPSSASSFQTPRFYRIAAGLRF